MQSQPLAIPGVSGPVTVQVNPWSGKRRLFVGGAEIPTKRGKFELPGPDGQPLPGRIDMMWWDVYPKLEIGGTKYPTGPEVPTGVKVVALLPFVLVVGGFFGAIFGA